MPLTLGVFQLQITIDPVLTGLINRLATAVESLTMTSNPKLDEISAKLDGLLAKETEMFVDLQPLKDAVAADTNAVNSAVTLIQGMADKIQNLSTQPTVNPQDLADLAASFNAQSQALAAAVVANTPVNPAPEPVPAPDPNQLP